MAEQYEIIGASTSQNINDGVMVSVPQDDQYSSLPPGPEGPQAVPVASLPPGPCAPQAIPVAALPPGPSGPQAVPVAVQYSATPPTQNVSIPVQQQAQFEHNQNLQQSQQSYQTTNTQVQRNDPVQQQYLIQQQQQQQSQGPHNNQPHLQYQIVVQQPGTELSQSAYSPSQQSPMIQQPVSTQSYPAPQQYIHVQQSSSVVPIPNQNQPRQVLSQQNQYQYQAQDAPSVQQKQMIPQQHPNQQQMQPHQKLQQQQEQHSQQHQHHTLQQHHPPQQQHSQHQHHPQLQHPQQQYVVMQVQQQPQQQQVVRYQYQQPANVQHHQQGQQPQHRLVIPHRQPGIAVNQPGTPQRFLIKSQQYTQRHVGPTIQGINQAQNQVPIQINTSATNQTAPTRQQWQSQQQGNFQSMQPAQVGVQQGMPQKRTIMIQSHSPMRGNVIRLQPNTTYQSVAQPRIMQTQQPNSGTVVQPVTPSNSSLHQQHTTLRMTNGSQGSSHMIQAASAQPTPSQISSRQMVSQTAQGQFQQAIGMNTQQQPIQMQQQPTQRLQNPINNQWVNRPIVSLQSGQQPQIQRPTTPQQQPFVIQMRQEKPQQNSNQDTHSNQPADIAYDVEHVFNENGREVRKMPIKLGNDTFWVDVCKTDNKAGALTSDEGTIAEDSIMLNLEMDGSGGSDSNPVLSQGSSTISLGTANDDKSQLPVQTPLQNDWRSNKSKMTDELKVQIIKLCCEDLISPAELASRFGVNVVQIRKVIKDAGQKLPTKYKITNSKNLSTTIGHAASSIATTSSMSSRSINCVTHNQITMQGTPRIVPSTGVGTFRQVIVTDTSGNKIHSIPGSNQTSALTLPQKPTPPGLTIIKPAVIPVSIATTPQDGKITQVEKLTVASAVDPSYKGKIIPGKLAVCRNCGGYSSDFNRCSRCKKPIPEDCKTVDDDTKTGKTGKGDVQNRNTFNRDITKDGLRNIRIQHKGKKKHNIDEPECIALSSDEDRDEDEDDDVGSRTGDEETETDEGNVKEEINESDMDSQIEKLVGEVKDIVDVTNNQGKTFASLQCRSIRIGSYKSMPKEKAVVTENAIQVKVPAVGNYCELVVITIRKTDITQILAHFGRTMPLLFLFCSNGACTRIRNALKMTSKTSGFWFDIDCSDETMKRLTILPDKMTDDTKNIMMKYYGNLIKEMDSKSANEILVRSSPKDIKIRQLTQIHKEPAPPNSLARPFRAELQPIQKYCQYPPTGSSSVSVSTEDYYCLEEESFLNDTTIDFYFKWLQFSILKPEDRDRTHIFSTFFYKRLTTRPIKQKNKVHPVEDDPKLSAADKRYERVKRWTKKMNIFDKDFIVVPINEQSHWFVAVICFPGKEGYWNIETKKAIDEPASQKRALNAQQQRKKRRPKDGAKRVMQIGSTSIIPLKGAVGSGLLEKLGLDDDQSDRDEADASDDDIFNPDDEELLSESLSPTMTVASKEHDSGDKDATCFKKISKDLSPNPSSNDNRLKSDDGMITNENKLEPSEVINSIVTEKLDAIKAANSVQNPSNEKVLDSEKELNGNNSASEESTFSPTTTSDISDETQPKIRIEQPCILIFDSLHSGSRAKVAATLRDYLACEYKAKMAHLGKQRTFDKETFRGCCPKVPQQPNFSDCGLYLLQYIEAFFETPIENYSLPITTLKHWFPKEVVKHKREKIAEIIRELASKQNPEKKFHFPTLEFVGVGSGYTDDEEDDLNDDDKETPQTQTTTASPSSALLVPVAKSSSALPKTTSFSEDSKSPEKMDDPKKSETDFIDSSGLEGNATRKEGQHPVIIHKGAQPNKVSMSSSGPPLKTTTISFGSFKRIQDSPKCAIAPHSTLQAVVPKITQHPVPLKPRIITLPSSPSVAAALAKKTVTSSQSPVTATPTSPIQVPIGKSSPLKQNQSTPSIQMKNLSSIETAKAMTTQTGNTLQSVQMTLAPVVATSGQTGHTVILKKAGKIETFPITQSNSSNVTLSTCSQNIDNSSIEQIIHSNRVEQSDNTNVVSHNAAAAKIDYSLESTKTNTVPQSSKFQEVKKCISNGVLMVHNSKTVDTVISNSDGNLKTATFEQSRFLKEQSPKAAPDSTTLNCNPKIELSSQDDGSNHLNLKKCINTSSSHNEVIERSNLQSSLVTERSKEPSIPQGNVNYVESQVENVEESLSQISKPLNKALEFPSEHSNHTIPAKRTLLSTLDGNDIGNASREAQTSSDADPTYNLEEHIDAKRPKLE